MQEDFIWIVTEDNTIPTPVEGQRGWGEEMQKRMAAIKEVRLNAVDLEKKMAAFLQVVGRLFAQAEKQAQVDQQAGTKSRMQLTEAELSVEISAEGEVKLVAGGKAAGKGAIKLKFTKVESK
jgi:homogentisate 1,2-dioxygenase